MKIAIIFLIALTSLSAFATEKFFCALAGSDTYIAFELEEKENRDYKVNLFSFNAFNFKADEINIKYNKRVSLPDGPYNHDFYTIDILSGKSILTFYFYKRIGMDFIKIPTSEDILPCEEL